METILKTKIAPLDFLLFLDEQEIQIFSIDSIYEQFPHIENVKKAVDSLVHKLFLIRLERCKYCRNTFRDENVIGTFLVDDGVIAYWTALNLHLLTEQFSNTIFVQTTHTKRPKRVLGTQYQFVTATPHKRCGIKTNGTGNYKYAITDIEKTIIDCFDLPQYSGGYAELIEAFRKAELSEDRLIEYCAKMNNISIIKRLGYLSEKFEKRNMENFIAFARSRVNKRYYLFDPFGEDTGRFSARWRLRINITL